LFALCLIVRWPHLSQSLWYDELTTLGEYVLQPWARILAPAAGEYVPNNHLLHTVLAKLIYGWGTRGLDPLPPRESLLRIPAVIAGSLVPIALAWPLRKREPLIALGIAIVAAFHPWLVVFSVEARGYSLLLLLGVIATHLLPENRRCWPIGYAVVLAMTAYTVPLGILLIPGHAVAMWVCRREAFRSWLIGLTFALVLIAALYLPAVHGLWSYYRHPFAPSMSYREFLDALPRFALAGERLPRRANPYFHLPDSSFDAVYWALPVITIVIGSVFAWSRPATRPLLVTMGTTSLLGILLPTVVSGATEVRFVPWMLPWFCLAFVALLTAANVRVARIAAVFAFVTLVSWQLLTDMKMLPFQPIRGAIAQADQITPANTDIVVLYLGARESAGLYIDQAPQHQLVAAPDTASFLREEDRSRLRTGQLPWVVVIYEKLARDRDRADAETRGLWSELIHRYRPVARLPGQVTPVTIYAPQY
jgi:hypothetical protein